MADLVTLQQYKDFNGLESVKNDARINHIIDQVSQLVKSYCSSTIIDYASSAKTEYFTIKDDLVDTIILEESPIISVTSVQERTGQADAYVTLITENSDSSGKYEYVVNDDSDSITRTSDSSTKYWPKGHKSVKVVYTAGYTSTPEDLKLAFSVNVLAYDNYKAFSKSYKKGYLYWLGSGKRKATRVKRIAEIIKLCELNIKKRGW